MHPTGRPVGAAVRGHVLGELGFRVGRGPDGEVHGTAAIVPQLWAPGTGALRTSVLACWADILTGLLAVDLVAPRVPVTLQLDVNLYEPPAGVERIDAVARQVKAGRTVFVATVDFADQDGAVLGTGTGTFTVAPDPAVTFPEGLDVVGALGEPGGPLTVPLAERTGCERLEPGVAVLPRRDESLNASGSVNGGLLALAVEEAALSAGDGSPLAMIAMRYLRPVRVGPAVAVAAVRAGVGTVEVHDEGRDGALAVVATTRAFGAP